MLREQSRSATVAAEVASGNYRSRSRRLLAEHRLAILRLKSSELPRSERIEDVVEKELADADFCRGLSRSGLALGICTWTWRSWICETGAETCGRPPHGTLRHDGQGRETSTR